MQGGLRVQTPTPNPLTPNPFRLVSRLPAAALADQSDLIVDDAVHVFCRAGVHHTRAVGVDEDLGFLRKAFELGLPGECSQPGVEVAISQRRLRDPELYLIWHRADEARRRLLVADHAIYIQTVE